MPLIRYDTNPFLTDLVISTTKKQVRVSDLGGDNNVLINQSTGEIKGTHVVTYKKVDNEEFIKLFTKNIALTFGLTSAGLKALNVVIWALQNTAVNKDLIQLESSCLNSFLQDNKEFNLKLSLPTFNRGLSELAKNKIVAHQRVRGLYYINPNFAFNGNRIAFTVVIDRAKKEEIQRQLEL